MTTAAYNASTYTLPRPSLVTNGASAAPPNPTHHNGSSSSPCANTARAHDATAAPTNATHDGTRWNAELAAYAHTCSIASANPRMLEPNDRSVRRSRTPHTAIAAANARPASTRSAGVSVNNPRVTAQLRNVPTAATAASTAIASMPYRPSTPSRSRAACADRRSGPRAMWGGVESVAPPAVDAAA